MSKSTISKLPDELKTIRKPRAAKQLTAEEISNQIEKLSLAQKPAIRDLINSSIEADRQRLEDQLKLIQGNTPAAQPVKPDFPEDHIS